MRSSAPDGRTIVFVGDGSYLMMNSDLYSSVLSGHPMIVIVCDNGGFAVIDRLQVNQGGASFNNLLADSRTPGELVRVDFAAHAAAMGCDAEVVSTIAELATRVRAGPPRRAHRRSSSSPPIPTPGPRAGRGGRSACPRRASSETIRDARAALDEARADQRSGI